MPLSTITYLTTVELEPGALKLLPEALQRLGIRRPLVISDRGVAAV